MFWHKAMFGGIGKQREELLASHDPPSPLGNMDLSPALVSASPRSSASGCAACPNPASGRSFSLTPDLDLAWPFTRSPVSAPNRSVPSAAASRSRKTVEAEKEGFLEMG